MDRAVGLGRVAVVDAGEGARRVLRALRELAHAGRAGLVVAVNDPKDRPGRFAREADASVDAAGSPLEVLRAARAESAWLGPATIAERAAFAEACHELGVRHLGPPAEALRRLAAPDGLAQLAEQLGISLAHLEGADPRHHLVEVLVARDGRGQLRILGVGDASLRRGGVAVLAESPSPALTAAGDGVARELAARAVMAAGWVGVAAVQLLVDPHTRRWSLLGLDAFAQSGPAVEALAGLDVVALALRLAAGDALEGEAVPLHGHAFAARIAVQAPGEDEARAAGRVMLLRLPSRLGVRADAAVDEGERAPPGDAVLATVVARGESRAEALVRLEQALADSDVLLRGSGSSKAWLLALCGRPEVQRGEAGIGTLEAIAAGEPLVPQRREAALLASAVESYEAELDLERARFLAEARRGRPRVGPSSGRSVELRYRGQRFRFDVRQTGPRTYRVGTAGSPAVYVRVERLGRLERRMEWNGQRLRILLASDGLDQMVQVDGVPHRVAREPAGLVVSPMPAVVVAIPVEPGQQVAAGDPVARIESMKVETLVLAPEAGIVREVLVAVNGQVDAGAPLVRLEPLGERPAQVTEPVDLGPPPPAVAGGPRERWMSTLEELHRLLLGFDVATADARRLATGWKELAAAVPPDDEEVLRLEEEALRAFADLQSLFSRALPAGAAADAKPPLEELWRYLHEPEAGGAALSPRFVAMLQRALAHYGVTLDAAARALSLALLRIQKAHERADEQLQPLLGLLERRLSQDPPRGLTAPDARDLLDRLAELGQEHFPALADLAREVRYRRFDRPALEEARQAAYVQAEADLGRMGAASPEERERIAGRLVESGQAMATLLVQNMAVAPADLRAKLIETLLRRYYRVRPLGPITARDVDGVPCVFADYRRNGEDFRVAATQAGAAEAAQAARRVAWLGADLSGRELVAELYLWLDVAEASDDAAAEALRAALTQGGFGKNLRRVSVLLALPGHGVGSGSQRHFTFRLTADGGLAEDRRYRGVHPMLFERMQLQRLSKFNLERLPSVEDVYLYRGAAQANPKDERLFAMAEVRDVTAVRDAAGRVVRLPHFERMFHEALAGMRRFQARRAPNQRLEWNRVILTVGPPLQLTREEVRTLAERLAPATAGAGLEMALIDARTVQPETGTLHPVLLRVITQGGQGLSLRYDEPTDRPLEPMGEYQQKVVQLRRRGLTHPHELVRMLAPAEPQGGIPRGEFVEHDLDGRQQLVPVHRPPGQNTANVVVGVVKSYTERHPEGMQRVVVMGDPGREMGSVAEPECRRIDEALALAQKLGVPLEWFEVCAGAKISMTTGTENMDWVSRVLRRIIEFTQGGGEINVVVLGITVGAQPYWNAEATMLMHTKGILVMTPGASMVLTGKQALEYSGSVSAEDNEGIGGYDRIMGPNGQAQYQARSVAEAIDILMRHYDHAYRAPGERFPRRAPTGDPKDRDIRPYPHGSEGGAGFETVGDVFSQEKNPDRKKPFEIRRIMAACIDQDHPPLERWKDLRGGDTGVVWDAHLGGWPVCLIGIQSRPLPRLEFVPADGPEFWSAGTLFPQSSKKIARAINAASGNRPVVVLANLSGFDGSPESMRRLQLEYGAEIGRAVVNFQGPVVFCVVSRYHGGAFVVFAKTLRDEMEIVAVEGARASVIGGAPAAAVVFAREVENRTRKDPRVVEAEQAAHGGGAARARLGEVIARVRSEKLGEVGEEFDRIHSVERALKVGSLDRIISPASLRPYLIDAIERGMARAQQR